MSITPPEAMPRHLLERKLRGSRRVNIVLSVITVAAVLFGGWQWSIAQNPGSAAQGSAAQDAGAAMQIERRLANDPMAVGNLEAPVVLNEWIDLRCPYCAVFSRDTLPIIMQEYVDTGLVRIEFHDVAFFGEESERAATAARAAGEQGKYVEFVSAIFDSAPESGHAPLTPEDLLKFAEQVGVPDLAKFERDMQREDLRDAVRASTATAQQLGVSGVPFFAVNDQALSGAQPIAGFRQFLDLQLQNG